MTQIKYIPLKRKSMPCRLCQFIGAERHDLDDHIAQAHPKYLQDLCRKFAKQDVFEPLVAPRVA
jgi:hypothetical protein